jgi:catechol 2,3-dioxygenase-like lactoylglutathione lyase family enzyme
MLENQPLIAFVATKNPAVSRRFYEDVLGLRFVADEPSALIFDAAGTMLRIQKVDRLTPHPFTTIGWKVVDMRATVAALTKLGVKFERYEFLSQDDHGVWTTPDGSAVAWFKDPDGNVVSLTAFAKA